jgi:tetratricopeptide (TPR) repeat protein
MSLAGIVDLRRRSLRRRTLDFIALADQARDARQWELAAGLYRKALGRYPRNSGIWVQYGHALKEAGELRDSDKLTQAEMAYRTALSLDPSASDSYLQLGHVLKLQGKAEAAQAAYLRAFALDPTVFYPLEELRGIGWSDAQTTELRALVEPYLAPSCSVISHKRLGNSECVPVTHAEIYCLRKPSFRDEVALFATYSPHGRLKAHVGHYLNSLKRHGISVILIVHTDTPSATPDIGLLNELDGVFIRRAEGYDFAAWAHILRLHPEFVDAKILYLINDSVIGPTNQSAFANLLTRLRNCRADVIGLTESFERGWHFQSYFLALKSRALSSAAFSGFVSDIAAYKDKENVIKKYELRFAPALKMAGLDCEPLFSASDFRNPTQYRWKELLQSGFPFVKVETLSGVVPELDITEWRELLIAQGYDVSLAERTLAELDAPQTANGSKPALRARIESSGLFDPAIYLSLNDDLTCSTDSEAWEHFLLHGLSEGRHFTSSEGLARLLAGIHTELSQARESYFTAASNAFDGADNSEIAALFRRKGIRIGVFCSAVGNFYMQEIANMLAWGLQALEIDAIQRNETADKDELFEFRIFVAPHEFFTLGEGTDWTRFADAPGSVLYNVEQIQTPWFCRAFRLLLKAPLVLDLNFQSAEILRRAGCNVVHFMPGHLPTAPYAKPCADVSGIELVRGYPFAHQPYNWLEQNELARRPIDLLFVGSSAPRRDQALARLRDLVDQYRFLCVYTRQDAPLTPRSYLTTSSEINCALAQRAKIVVNIHRDWLGYFEWSRLVMQGFWQGACVLSDPGLANPIFESGVHYLEEDVRHIAELARWLLGTREGRDTLETTRMAGYRRATELGAMRVALSPVLSSFKRLLAI